MNTKLRKEAKTDFEKYFSKLMNNAVFGKTMENVRNHRDIKIVTTNRQRNKLTSEPNYHTRKYISDVFQKMYFRKYISNDVERWFDTSNYDENDKRPLSTCKNKKVIGIFKDELGGKIITKFVALRAKAYADLIDGYDDDYEKNIIINKKAKGTKKCVIKRELMFENYKDSLFNNKIILELQQRFKIDHQKVYAEEVNKIALGSNNNKRLRTFDKVTTYPYGANAFKVCESEMLSKYK